MAVNAEKNQQQQQNNMNQPGTQAPTSGGVTASAQPASRVANYSSGAQPTGSTGSGRFTNLNKYLNANQGAGDRLASGIGSNIEKQTAQNKREANTQAADVRAGIESAQNKVNQGNQYVQQVNAQDFNAQNIAGDQNKLQDFTQFRTNQAVGADALANQVGQAQATAQNLQAQQQQQLQNASTEQGRFNLLKQAFGGGTVYQNPYSTGQQKLDQLFLQAGGANNINNLQNQVRGNLNQTGQILNTLGQNANTIGEIGTQAQGIAKGLQDRTNALTNQYVADVEATAPEVNAQRAADQAWAQDQYAKLQSGGQIDQRFADMLGLNQGQNLYNTLTGKNVNDFMNFGNTNLQGFGQLANTDQENYYNALTQLAGMTPGFIADGNPVAAVANNNTIGGQLTSNQDAFNKATQGKDFGYTWGGGAVNQYNTNVSSPVAQNLLSGLSSSGAQTLRGLDVNSLISTTGIVNPANPEWSKSNLTRLGFNPQDAQVIMNAASSNQISANNSFGNNVPYYDDYRIGALQNAANLLYDQGYFNRVNIAPPSDIQNKNFGVT